jgi:hypothetical protein
MSSWHLWLPGDDEDEDDFSLLPTSARRVEPEDDEPFDYNGADTVILSPEVREFILNEDLPEPQDLRALYPLYFGGL